MASISTLTSRGRRAACTVARLMMRPCSGSGTRRTASLSSVSACAAIERPSSGCGRNTAAISESIAICLYFEKLKPAPNLFGEGPLESALHQLDTVEAPAKTPAKREKYKGKTGGQSARTPRGRGLHRMAAKKGAKAAQPAVSSQPQPRNTRSRNTQAGTDAGHAAGLPKTGAAFWLELISAQPQTAVDISNAAIATLGLKPEQKRQIQKIKQRVAPALSSLVQAQKIRDTGAGRERRFFKAA